MTVTKALHDCCNPSKWHQWTCCKLAMLRIPTPMKRQMVSQAPHSSLPRRYTIAVIHQKTRKEDVQKLWLPLLVRWYMHIQQSDFKSRCIQVKRAVTQRAIVTEIQLLVHVHGMSWYWSFAWEPTCFAIVVIQNLQGRFLQVLSYTAAQHRQRATVTEIQLLVHVTCTKRGSYLSWGPYLLQVVNWYIGLAVHEKLMCTQLQ